MNSVVCALLIDLAFQYKSPSYRDLPNFADEVRFKDGLLDYIQLPKTDFLMTSGVPVQEILFSMLGKE